MSDRPIHIALTFDDNFWAPAYALMRSICLASRRPADLVFHLIHIGLAARHRETLDRIAAEYPARLQHTDLAHHAAYRDFVALLPMARPFTPVIYARLLLDRLLPPEVERVVYLDCDTYVRGPIETLAELDLEGHPVAAVLDPGRHKAMLGRDFRQNRELFSFNFAYFNSGMLVIDRAAYGRADLPAATRRLHDKRRPRPHPIRPGDPQPRLQGQLAAPRFPLEPDLALAGPRGARTADPALYRP